LIRRSRLKSAAQVIPAIPALIALSCQGGLFGPLPSQIDDDPVPFDHKLTFARHVDQAFSEGRIDRIMAEAGGLLASVETECPDVHCPVTFTRVGGVSAFSEGGAILTSESQLDAVFSVDADFKIVTFMVGVCGAPSGDDPAVVLGCASTGGSVVIVHDAPTDVWAHEWGHVQGLPHRNDCARNLMHAFELETNAVNARERTALLTPTPGSAFQRARTAEETECLNCSAAPAEVSGGEPLEQVISRRFLQGIPSALLGNVESAEVVEELLAHWAAAPPAHVCANLARLLGHAGDPRACAPLGDLALLMAGELQVDDLAAISESLLALGRLAAVDDSGTALALLTAGTSPEFWSARGLTVRADTDSTVSTADALARISVMALGLAGTDDARQHLSALRQRESVSRSRDPWFSVQVEEALALLGDSSARVLTGQRAERQP